MIRYDMSATWHILASILSFGNKLTIIVNAMNKKFNVRQTTDMYDTLMQNHRKQVFVSTGKKIKIRVNSYAQ